MSKVVVERTVDTASVAGVAARKWRVTVEGEPYEDYWLATDAAFLRELAWDRSSRTLERFQHCFETPIDQSRPQRFEHTKEYQQLKTQGFPTPSSRRRPATRSRASPR